MDASPNSDPSRRLRALLRAADIRAFRTATATRVALFPGRTREWSLLFMMNEHWFNIRTFVCTLPSEPGLRARLIEHALGLNARLALVKFVLDGKNLSLDLEYRVEHVDTEVVNNIVGLALSALEEHYPAIFRIATGDDVLQQLDYTKNGEAA